MGSSSRQVLTQGTHSSVASSTASLVFHTVLGGESAWNRRLTLSSVHGMALSVRVVCTISPRMAPRRPYRRTSRSTVQRNSDAIA